MNIDMDIEEISCWDSRGQLKKNSNFKGCTKGATQFYRIFMSKVLLNFPDSWFLALEFPRDIT